MVDEDGRVCSHPQYYSSVNRLIKHSVEALSKHLVQLRVFEEESAACATEKPLNPLADVFSSKTSVQCTFEYSSYICEEQKVSGEALTSERSLLVVRENDTGLIN